MEANVSSAPEIVVLARERSDLAPMDRWFPDVHVRAVIAGEALAAFGGPDEAAAVVEDYDATGEVETAVYAAHARCPITCLIAPHAHDAVRAARMREYLQLPGQDPESAVAFSDLVVMRGIWRMAGLPTVSSAPVESATDLVEYAARHDFPLRVQPRHSASPARGRVLHSDQDVDAWLGRDWRLAPGTRSTWMIEAHTGGRYLAVDGLWHHGMLEIAWVSTIPDPHLTESGGQPVQITAMLDLDDELVTRCRVLAGDALRMLPDPGPMAVHVELRITAGRILLDRASVGLGTPATATMYERAFDLNLLRRATIAQVDPLGLTTMTRPIPVRQAGYVSVPRRTGRVRALPRLLPGDFASSWLVSVDWYVQPGDLVGPDARLDQPAVVAVATGENRAQVLARLAAFAAWAQENVHYTTPRAPELPVHTDPRVQAAA